MKTKGKQINLNCTPSNYETELIFEKVVNLKLSEPLLKENISLSQYNSKDYFKTSIKIETKEESFLGGTEVEALSTKKNVLEDLISKTNLFFSNATTEFSLFRFFNSFKKDLKRTLKIESDDEFIIHIKNEFRDIRIVKLSGDDNIYYTMN